jgi:hypothetical protein
LALPGCATAKRARACLQIMAAAKQPRLVERQCTRMIDALGLEARSILQQDRGSILPEDESRRSPLCHSHEKTNRRGARTRARATSLPHAIRERVCCLLVLNSVTSTPQWIRQPKAVVVAGDLGTGDLVIFPRCRCLRPGSV